MKRLAEKAETAKIAEIVNKSFYLTTWYVTLNDIHFFFSSFFPTPKTNSDGNSMIFLLKGILLAFQQENLFKIKLFAAKDTYFFPDDITPLPKSSSSFISCEPIMRNQIWTTRFC